MPYAVERSLALAPAKRQPPGNREQQRVGAAWSCSPIRAGGDGHASRGQLGR